MISLNNLRTHFGLTQSYEIMHFNHSSGQMFKFWEMTVIKFVLICTVNARIAECQHNETLDSIALS